MKTYINTAAKLITILTLSLSAFSANSTENYIPPLSQTGAVVEVSMDDEYSMTVERVEKIDSATEDDAKVVIEIPGIRRVVTLRGYKTSAKYVLVTIVKYKKEDKDSEFRKGVPVGRFYAPVVHKS